MKRKHTTDEYSPLILVSNPSMPVGVHPPSAEDPGTASEDALLMKRCRKAVEHVHGDQALTHVLYEAMCLTIRYHEAVRRLAVILRPDNGKIMMRPHGPLDENGLEGFLEAFAVMAAAHDAEAAAIVIEGHSGILIIAQSRAADITLKLLNVAGRFVPPPRICPGELPKHLRFVFRSGRSDAERAAAMAMLSQTGTIGRNLR
jgi:hypothetical protein